MANATLTIEDAYRDWLSIPAKKILPDYYVLLGLSEFEKSSEKIQAATQVRFKIVRPRCLRYPDVGSQLLNEIAAANVCLTHPRTKAEYDATLRARGQQAALEIGQRFCRDNPRLREVLKVAEETLAEEIAPPPVIFNRPTPPIPDRRRTLIGLAIGGGALALAALLMFAAFTIGKQVADSKPAPAASPKLTASPELEPTPGPTLTPAQSTVSNPVSPPKSIAQRFPRPAEAELARVRAKIRQEVESRRALSLRLEVLAEELLAGWNRIEPPSNFAHLDEARLLFIEARAADRALETASQIEDHYEVPTGEVLNSTVRDLSGSSPPLTPAEWAAAVRWGQEHVRERFKKSEYPQAVAILNLAMQIAALAKRAGGTPDELAHILQEQKAFAILSAKWGSVQPTLEALELSPDDQAANLTVGRFLCFTCENWEQGAKHLFASGVPMFVAPAKLDVVASMPLNESKPSPKVDAAEAWMKLAEEFTASGQTADAAAIRRRARFLLWEAKPLSTGLQHALVVARLAELEEAGLSD